MKVVNGQSHKAKPLVYEHNCNKECGDATAHVQFQWGLLCKTLVVSSQCGLDSGGVCDTMAMDPGFSLLMHNSLKLCKPGLGCGPEGHWMVAQTQLRECRCVHHQVL